MDLDRFISTRKGHWNRLDEALKRAARSGLDTMSADQLRDLGTLYRQACSDLVFARTVLQNGDLAEFLNRLVGEAYGAIYRRTRFSWAALQAWFLRGFPAAVRRHWRAVALSWVLLLGGLSAGFFATLADREAFQFIVPSEYHGLYGKKQGDLREARFGKIDADRAAGFSSQIYVNNIRVSFMAFAMGGSFGVLTVAALLYNGALLGSIAANFHRWGQDAEFWGLIIPHGAVELSCIALAGAAGFILAWALIAPGRRSRAEALAAASREAIPIALGCAPFLVLAGLIEGFVTPMESLGPWPKMTLGVVTGVAFWAWLLFPRRDHA
ncbi:MAG: stage II sporulation protein M [Planctomycetes bacterium]|nr:stage II sporulation protein M [Planctomycetota bacterium]